MWRRRTQREPSEDKVFARRCWPPTAGGSEMRPRPDAEGQLTLASAEQFCWSKVGKDLTGWGAGEIRKGIIGRREYRQLKQE